MNEIASSFLRYLASGILPLTTEYIENEVQITVISVNGEKITTRGEGKPYNVIFSRILIMYQYYNIDRNTDAPKSSFSKQEFKAITHTNLSWPANGYAIYRLFVDFCNDNTNYNY